MLDPWGLVEIDGWRKSMDEVAAFYFTALPDSYAARTGRPDNVGVIGVALFRERERPMPMESDYMARAESRARRGRHGEAKASPAGPHATRRSPASAPATAAASTPARCIPTSSARATTPDEIIRIYYDSRRNLVARGIIPPPGRFAGRVPEPFPSGFVPDP